jgi:type IV secretory pathway TraG/TraD family ATPase VirD4
MLVLAPSGAGKSTQYVLPNALQLDGKRSAVFTDPSGELHALSHRYLKKKGYQAIRLDFRPQHRAFQFNPLHQAIDAVEAQKIADVLINSAYPIAPKDSFWTDSAKAFLGLLINLLRLSDDVPKTLVALCEWLFVLSIHPNTLDRKALSLLPSLQQKSYQAFFAQDSKVIAGVLSTCKTTLGKVVNDPHLAWLTNESTFNFSQLRTLPTALFIVVPEKDIPYFNFILSLFFRQLFDTCTDPPRSNQPYYPIYCFLDEFGQFSIPNFPSYINILRKYRVSVSIIVQEIAQIKAKYKQEAPAILYGALSNHLYFPGLSLSTTIQLEQMLGQEIIHGRAFPLLPRHAIRTLPKKSGIFISGNHRPVLLRMRPWYNSWLLRKRGRMR